MQGMFFQIPDPHFGHNYQLGSSTISTKYIKFRPFGCKFCDTVLFLLEEYWHKVQAVKPAGFKLCGPVLFSMKGIHRIEAGLAS